MMIEERIRDYLMKSNLSVVPHVFMETPEDPPEEYVVIEKTGSGKINHITQAMIAIKSVSMVSMYRAACINEEVKKIMEMIIYAEDIFKCEVNSDYNFTNTTTKEYRYQAVFNLFY